MSSYTNRFDGSTRYHYSTRDGEWGLIKDLCYLPEGRNAEDYEMEVEL